MNMFNQITPSIAAFHGKYQSPSIRLGISQLGQSNAFVLTCTLYDGVNVVASVDTMVDPSNIADVQTNALESALALANITVASPSGMKQDINTSAAKAIETSELHSSDENVQVEHSDAMAAPVNDVTEANSASGEGTAPEVTPITVEAASPAASLPAEDAPAAEPITKVDDEVPDAHMVLTGEPAATEVAPAVTAAKPPRKKAEHKETKAPTDASDVTDPSDALTPVGSETEAMSFDEAKDVPLVFHDDCKPSIRNSNGVKLYVGKPLLGFVKERPALVGHILRAEKNGENVLTDKCLQAIEVILQNI